MTYCITSRRGSSDLLELVPKSFDDTNKICSKQKPVLYESRLVSCLKYNSRLLIS